MPIAPCFDPTTGASGGSQGGGGSTGADLSALGFEAVDLTDGWTLYDPNSLVNSVSHSGGINTVTMNALGAGSNDYSFTIGGNLKMPRWYKNLSALDANGGEVRLNTGDTYSLHTIRLRATCAVASSSTLPAATHRVGRLVSTTAPWALRRPACTRPWW